MASWISTVAALAGLLLGGVVTYLTTRAQLRAEAEHAYDRALRDLRLPHYQQLFHLTEGIPRQWRMSDAPSRVELLALRGQFRNWYFSDQAGGMFLSQAARDAYFLLQNHLQSAAAHLTDDSQPVGEEDSASLRRRASELRHQLSADLGAAEQPRQRWIVPRSVPPPRSEVHRDAGPLQS